MSYQCLSILLKISVIFVLVFEAAGCVTKSDLEKVRRDVDAQRRASSSQDQRLRHALDELQTASKEKSRIAGDTESRIRAIETKLEVMTDDIIREMGAMKKALGEVETKRPGELEDIEGRLGDLKKGMKELQQEQLADNAKMQRLHALTATLLRTYQLQLENLRGYLRELDQIAKELTPPSESFQKNR